MESSSPRLKHYPAEHVVNRHADDCPWRPLKPSSSCSCFRLGHLGWGEWRETKALSQDEKLVSEKNE